MTEVGGQMIEVGSGNAEVGKSEHSAEGMAHSGLEEGGRQIAAVRFFSSNSFPQ
jgi:hypothetical protein